MPRNTTEQLISRLAAITLPQRKSTGRSDMGNNLYLCPLESFEGKKGDVALVTFEGVAESDSFRVPIR